MHDPVNSRLPVIDAEFTVVDPPRTWGGLGLPPDWPTWNWFQKLVYWVVLFGILGTVWGVVHLIVPQAR